MKQRFLLILLSALLTSNFLAAQTKKYRLGLKFSEFEYNKVPKRYFSVRGTRTMPQAYSLKEYCPKPLNQLDLPTSPGWAAAYAAYTIIKAHENGWNKIEITRNAFAPLYPYYKVAKDSVAKTPVVSLPEVLDAMKKYGTPKYIDLPSRYLYYTTPRIEEEASYYRISEYTRLFDKYDGKVKKIQAIKATLNDNLPVIIGMHIPKSFFWAKDFWQPRETFSRDLPGHALTIIGYDDTKYGGSFEVINSWGSDWGNDGFMWIRYGDLIQFTEYAFDIHVIPGKLSGIELGGSIELTLVDDKTPMEVEMLSPGYYKIAKSYPSGTLFTIKINNHSPAFIYAFASDLTGDVYPFFPPTYTSAALAKAASFYVPDENTPAIIDETIGTDYLCVLFSKEELDINALYSEIKRLQGPFIDKIKTALNNKIIAADQISYQKDGIGFKLVKAEKPVVVLIVEHEHM